MVGTATELRRRVVRGGFTARREACPHPTSLGAHWRRRRCTPREAEVRAVRSTPGQCVPHPRGVDPGSTDDSRERSGAGGDRGGRGVTAGGRYLRGWRMTSRSVFPLVQCLLRTACRIQGRPGDSWTHLRPSGLHLRRPRSRTKMRPRFHRRPTRSTYAWHTRPRHG